MSALRKNEQPQLFYMFFGLNIYAWKTSLLERKHNTFYVFCEVLKQMPHLQDVYLPPLLQGQKMYELHVAYVSSTAYRNNPSIYLLL